MATNTKSISKTSSGFSTTILCRFISRLTDSQKAIIRNTCFRDLLGLKCSEFPNHLALKLAKMYDPITKSIKINDSAIIYLNPFVVHQILGTTLNGRKIDEWAGLPQKVKDQANRIISGAIGQQGKHKTRAEDLITCVDENLDGDRLVRIFMLIVTSTFLFPSSYKYISNKFNAVIADVEDMHKYDWSTKIFEFLHEKIVNFQKKDEAGRNKSGVGSLGGCIFILVAAYFEYLIVPLSPVANSIPRILAWDDISIKFYECVEWNPADTKLKSIRDTFFHTDHAESSNFRSLSNPVVRSPITIPIELLDEDCDGNEVGDDIEEVSSPRNKGKRPPPDTFFHTDHAESSNFRSLSNPVVGSSITIPIELDEDCDGNEVGDDIVEVSSPRNKGKRRPPASPSRKDRDEGKKAKCVCLGAPATTKERSPCETENWQIRSCTKVIMQGVQVGRAVDLTRLDGYDELHQKLEEMFDIQGELSASLKKWKVIYTDDEDDMMLVGDDPWHEFCSMVKRIYIYEEGKGLTPKAKLPDVGDPAKPNAQTQTNRLPTQR